METRVGETQKVPVLHFKLFDGINKAYSVAALRCPHVDCYLYLNKKAGKCTEKLQNADKTKKFLTLWNAFNLALGHFRNFVNGQVV